MDTADHIILQAINGHCKFTSAQASELVSVIMAIKNIPADATVGIFSDGDWVVWALSNWLRVWQSQGYRTSDGKAVKYADLLVSCHTIAINRCVPVRLGKVRAHQKDGIVARLNGQADVYAKEGAL